MRIRDLIKMIAATTGRADVPASQLAVARGFLAVHSAPLADVCLRHLASAAESDENLYICRSLRDLNKYMSATSRQDFVTFTEAKDGVYVSTQEGYCGHDEGEWVTVAEALTKAGNKLDAFRMQVAP